MTGGNSKDFSMLAVTIVVAGIAILLIIPFIGKWRIPFLGNWGQSADAGDPGGRRLNELGSTPVFALMPIRASGVQISRIPASYQEPGFEAGGWTGPRIVVIFKSSAPATDVYEFYAREAAIAKWKPIGTSSIDRNSKVRFTN